MGTKRQVVLGIVGVAWLAGCATGSSSSDQPARPPESTDAQSDVVSDDAKGDVFAPLDGGVQELCGNGLDDDGDGRSDNGCPCTDGATQSCFAGDPGQAGKGACKLGLQACKAEGESWYWGECVGAIGPGVEACDGIDNDCDGTLDNGCPCQEGEEKSCESVCGTGKQACSGGAWGTCSAQQPTSEVCDTIDNDCDLQVDEGCECAVGESKPCSTGCGTGTQSCQAGVWGACSAPLPEAEICDTLDNNCNGQVDEQDVCLGKPCEAKSIGWKDCAGALKASKDGQTSEVHNINAGYVGTATWVCDDGEWKEQSATCVKSLCSYEWGNDIATSGVGVRLYVILANRSPDPPGLAYWNKSGYNANTIVSFAACSEPSTEFSQWKTAEAIVDRLYWTAFNRASDASGRSYWLSHFTNGTFATSGIKLGNYFTTFLESAQGEDVIALQKREQVAQYWVEQLVAHKCPWDAYGKTVLTSVSTGSNVSAVKNSIDLRIREMEAQGLSGAYPGPTACE